MEFLFSLVYLSIVTIVAFIGSISCNKAVLKCEFSDLGFIKELEGPTKNVTVNCLEVNHENGNEIDWAGSESLFGTVLFKALI